jgi:ATP:ADP antiporter, AAA family
MEALKRLWGNLFDIRPGEYLKTLFMALYLMLVLFAYYILKPVSKAMFLNNFNINKLPWLYVLIATIGGTLAYLYTKLSVKSSLGHAIDYATASCVAVLVVFWWAIPSKTHWVIYAFNIWVSLFSVILVSQGWLVAANLYTSREAKRLYGILGIGSVIGAAFGGQFTAVTVYYIGTNNLLLASAGMVVLSYVAYRMAVRSARRPLGAVKAASGDNEFSFREITGAIRRHRHLQVIIAITTLTFIVDVMVEFQFSAMAQRAYHGSDLTAFLGHFYGFWLNLITFVLQLFLTGYVVRRLGVGGALQIMPLTIMAASVATLVSPSLLSTASTELAGTATRYSFNKTGIELLYLPLPLDLRNRTKAFVDVFSDRLARGIGGMILVFFTSVVVIGVGRLPLVVMAIAVAWIGLSIVARRQYVATVRDRLATRRLELETARLSVSDPGTIGLLEQAARGDNPRQAAFAVTTLSEAAGYRIGSLIASLAESAHPQVRARAFEAAKKIRTPALLDAALKTVRNARGPQQADTAAAAVDYALAVSPDRKQLARQLFDHPNPAVQNATMSALAGDAELARDLIDHEWLAAAAVDRDPQRRSLAALAIRARGDTGTEALHLLLKDPDPRVAAAAIRTAGSLKNREYLGALIGALASPRLRAAAIDALGGFGDRVVGSMSDLLADPSVSPGVRRQIPRVLHRIPNQRSVDALMGALPDRNLAVRAAALKALNKLRDAEPKLEYGAEPLFNQVDREARHYFELHAALAAFSSRPTARATSLLVRTLEHRLKDTLERLFRLLGLRYPPKQIYAAYLAVTRRDGDQFSAAIDFLENILDPELKRILVPLLDEDGMLARRGQELFRIDPKDAASALRDLIRSGDAWLSACAIAAAAELKLRELLAEIRAIGDEAGREVAEVARAAEAALS